MWGVVPHPSRWQINKSHHCHFIPYLDSLSLSPTLCSNHMKRLLSLPVWYIIFKAFKNQPKLTWFIFSMNQLQVHYFTVLKIQLEQFILNKKFQYYSWVLLLLKCFISHIILMSFILSKKSFLRIYKVKERQKFIYCKQ